MKVLVHNSLPGTGYGRFPVLLSVAQELLDEGHQVMLIECDGVVPACLLGIRKDKQACLHCMTRASKGRRLMEPRASRRAMSEFLGRKRIAELRDMRDELTDARALKGLMHDGTDIGYAALSTYGEIAREPEPDLSDPGVRTVVQDLINTARIVHEAWRVILDSERPDQVITFNCRLAIDRSVLRLCQQRGVDCQVWENSSVADLLTSYDNALPQDIACITAKVEALWAGAPADREEVAGAFYRMRRDGATSQVAAGREVKVNETVYTRDQQPGLLPSHWDARSKNIVFFGSSDDEYSAISAEWESSLYPTQADAIDAICGSLAGDAGIRIHVRMHPKLRDLDRGFINQVLDLEKEHRNLHVYAPGSKVCSYALLDACDIACSFRSTMGFEATHWGKPSVAFADSIFSGRGATYDPRSHDEVVALLRSDLQVRDRLPTLKYGYYRMRLGSPNPHYRVTDPSDMRGYLFKDDPIRVSEDEMLLHRWRTFGRWARWL